MENDDPTPEDETWQTTATNLQASLMEVRNQLKEAQEELASLRQSGADAADLRTQMGLVSELASAMRSVQAQVAALSTPTPSPPPPNPAPAPPAPTPDPPPVPRSRHAWL